MATKAEVKEFIKGMTVLELAELIKELETELGVSAAAPVAVAAAAPAAAAAEAQTEFTVILKSAGAKKLEVIKEIRALIPTLGLKEAKDLVDGAPKTVKEGVTKDEANKIKEKLVAVGAEIEIK